MMPPPQTTQRVLIVGPVGERHVPGRRPRSTATPRCSRTPLRAEHLGDVVVRLVGERAEQRVAEVDEVDLRRRRPRGRGTRRSSSRGSGPRARRPARRRSGRRRRRRSSARPASISDGVAVGLLEHAEDPRAQPRRVVERVERERVLLRARGAEEVRLRAGRQHERVAARCCSPVGGRDRARRRVDDGDLRRA